MAVFFSDDTAGTLKKEILEVFDRIGTFLFNFQGLEILCEKRDDLKVLEFRLGSP